MTVYERMFTFGDLSKGYKKIGSQFTTLAIVQTADITLNKMEILIGFAPNTSDNR
jgi:hypothetical protein